MLQNPLPVMTHLWSEIYEPELSEALAPVVDEFARKFAGKMDAVGL